MKCKDKFFLVFILASKRADLKVLARLVNVSKLTFASTTELKEILDLDLGSVTPLGIINDKVLQVKILIDKDIIGNKALMYSNTNTKTISLKYEDLIRYIEYTNH